MGGPPDWGGGDWEWNVGTRAGGVLWGGECENGGGQYDMSRWVKGGGAAWWGGGPELGSPGMGVPLI